MKRYDVEVNGIKTTLLLSDEDAKARGLKPTEEPKSKTPANKSRTPANKREDAVAKSFNAPKK